MTSHKLKREICIHFTNYQMVFLLVLMNLCFVSSNPAILVSPESVNALDKDTVTFHCIVEAEEINLFVNGALADHQDVIDKGFQESGIYEINETTKERNLTATASIIYNNTNITCRALNTENNVEVVFSDPAVLRVQGPLPSVGKICSFLDFSTVNISWSPPFTLPGTAVNGYNISLISNRTTTNYFTSRSYYVLQLSDITDSPCNEINITVSGYNGLNGENISISGIYLPSVPSPDTFIAVTIKNLVESNQLVNITVLIDVSNFCPGEYPELVDISVFRADNYGLVATHKKIIVKRSPHISVSGELNLKADEKYSAQILFENVLGEFNITSVVNFSTHAVQSIKIDYVKNSTVEVTCFFAPNTTAIGCEVIIVFLINKQDVESKRANRTGDTAILTFQKTVAGEYCFTVYDVERDGMLNQALTELFIIPSRPSTSEAITIELFASATDVQMTLSTSFSMLTYTGSLSNSPKVSAENSEAPTTLNGDVIAVISASAFVMIMMILCIVVGIVVYLKKHKTRSYPVSDKVMWKSDKQGSYIEDIDFKTSLPHSQQVKKPRIEETVHAELSALGGRPKTPIKQEPFVYSEVIPTLPPTQIRGNSSK